MKKYLMIMLVITGLASCTQNRPANNTPSLTPAAQAKVDDAAIQAYFKANKITTAVKDTSGLYYQVLKPGTGPFPKATSAVTVNYSGKLLNGTPFDSADGYSTTLGAVVAGWTLGLQHINKGGTINLYIPSALAYGPDGGGPIPPNAVLVFKVDMLNNN